MKKAEIKIGGKYVAKVSGSLTVVQIDSVSPYGGWSATNTKTGRSIRIRSAARLRNEYQQVQPVRTFALDDIKVGSKVLVQYLEGRRWETVADIQPQAIRPIGIERIPGRGIALKHVVDIQPQG